MTSTIIWTIAVVTVLGLVLALVLYLVAQKFKVKTTRVVRKIFHKTQVNFT